MTTKTAYAHGEFCWVDLVSHDLASAKEFYGKLFGWTSVAYDTQGGPPYEQLEMNGQAVAGIGEMNKAMKSQGIPPMWNSYVNVEDIEAIVAKTAALGGTVTVPVMPVMEAGSLAFIQDPTGGQLGLWQANQHIGARLVNEPVALCWNELTTREVDKAREFYAGLFGWEFCVNHHSPSPTTYYQIENAGRGNGGLMRMDESWGDVPPCWGVYFAVADADATVARIEELGGKVFAPAFDIPVVGRMAAVSDPQGAVFNVIKLNNPE